MFSTFIFAIWKVFLFLQKIVKRFEIDEEKTRVAVLVFSDGVKLEFALDT